MAELPLKTYIDMVNNKLSRNMSESLDKKQEMLMDIDIVEYLDNKTLIMDMDVKISTLGGCIFNYINDNNCDCDIVITLEDGTVEIAEKHLLVRDDLVLVAINASCNININPITNIKVFMDNNSDKVKLNKNLYDSLNVTGITKLTLNIDNDADNNTLSNLKYVVELILDCDEPYNAENLFNDNRNLLKISKLSVVNHPLTSAENMFYDCMRLREAPEIDISEVTTAKHMFAYCESLVVVPRLNIRNCTDVTSMFYGCEALERIEGLEISALSNINFMFYNCGNLKYINLISDAAENIKTVASMLNTHSGADEGEYVIDISENSEEVIEGLSDLSVDGWTIKKN